MKIKILVSVLAPAYMLFGCIDKELRKAIENSDLYTFNSILNANKLIFTQKEKDELLELAQEKVIKRKQDTTSIRHSIFNLHTLLGAGMLCVASFCRCALSSNTTENILHERLQRMRDYLRPYEDGERNLLSEPGLKEAFTPTQYLNFTEAQSIEGFSNLKKELGFVPWLLGGVGLYHLFKGITNHGVKKLYQHALAIKTVIEHYPVESENN